MKKKLAIVLLAIGALTSTQTSAAQMSVASWSCHDNSSVDYRLGLLDNSNHLGKLLVRVWIYADGVTGKVEANGIVTDANYYQTGLDHRWDFDKAAFVIKANHTGHYYYFGDEKTAKPSMSTECKKTS